MNIVWNCNQRRSRADELPKLAQATDGPRAVGMHQVAGERRRMAWHGVETECDRSAAWCAVRDTDGLRSDSRAKGND